jgi:hypothetical protein
MKVVLNIYATRKFVAGGIQMCNSPEGFESIMEMHPEDEFIIEDEDSWNKYENFLDFLEVMGWKASDYFAITQTMDDLAALEAELELEAMYDEIMIEELAWYNHARRMGWE